MVLQVGIVGAGIGGLGAAIAVAQAGARVTVLEAAAELGEIGAGIQMTPNASRLLVRWGVDRVIGDNLVEFEEFNLRKRDGTKIGYTETGHNYSKKMESSWWLVHRMHLHSGLIQVAQQNGCDIIIDTRVTQIDWKSSQRVEVTTFKGAHYSFDLLIGADGLNSIVRRTIFPNVKPRPPTTNCAYRAVVPYDQIEKDPIAKELIQKLSMDAWIGERAYIISYPISAGKGFNMVLSHHRSHPVEEVQEVDMDELRATYKDFDPRIRRIVEMIPTARRWPLLVTGPLDSWSTEEKNVVLMGDAAHSMTNHMAQGAATSMEDGAFLGCVISHVIDGSITIPQAIQIYEQTRMPFVWYKQQVSFLNGALWHLPDGLLQEARDRVMAPELDKRPLTRSTNLYGDPTSVLSIYGYDAETDAKAAISAFLSKHEPWDEKTTVSDRVLDKYFGWWWPRGKVGDVKASKL